MNWNHALYIVHDHIVCPGRTAFISAVMFEHIFVFVCVRALICCTIMGTHLGTVIIQLVRGVMGCVQGKT